MYLMYYILADIHLFLLNTMLVQVGMMATSKAVLPLLLLPPPAQVCLSVLCATMCFCFSVCEMCYCRVAP